MNWPKPLSRMAFDARVQLETARIALKPAKEAAAKVVLENAAELMTMTAGTTASVALADAHHPASAQLVGAAAGLVGAWFTPDIAVSDTAEKDRAQAIRHSLTEVGIAGKPLRYKLTHLPEVVKGYKDGWEGTPSKAKRAIVTTYGISAGVGAAGTALLLGAILPTPDPVMQALAHAHLQDSLPVLQAQMAQWGSVLLGAFGSRATLSTDAKESWKAARAEAKAIVKCETEIAALEERIRTYQRWLASPKDDAQRAKFSKMLADAQTSLVAAKEALAQHQQNREAEIAKIKATYAKADAGDGDSDDDPEDGDGDLGPHGKAVEDA